MKKITTSLILLSLFSAGACAAPTDSGDGDGDTISGAGGTGVVAGAGGSGTVVPGAGGSGTVPGAGGSGTVPGAGGSATVTPVTCPAAAFPTAEGNGYASNGQMCGYMWTGAFAGGGTIDPPCGTAGPCFTTDFCASGTIPAQVGTTYPGVLIGMNAQQASDSMSNGAWTSSGSGLTPTFTTGGATGVTRVVIKSGATEYCAPATSGVAIPWASFQVECYNTPPGASFTAGMPINEVNVQINAIADMEQTFTDFCVTNIAVN